MRSWSFRVVTFLFMLSMVATPFAVVNAQDGELAPGATPVEDVTPTAEVLPTEGTATEPPATPTETVVDDVDDDASKPEAGIVGTPTVSTSDRSSLAAAGEVGDGIYDLYTATWKPVEEQGAIQIYFQPGATIVAESTIGIWYSSALLDITNLDLTFAFGDQSPMPVTHTISGEYIVLTFTEDFEADPAAGTMAVMIIDAEPQFPACGATQEGNLNSMNVLFSGADSQVLMTIEGEECGPPVDPAIYEVMFLPGVDSLLFSIQVPDADGASGAVLTIEYPADRLELPSEPVTIYTTSGSTPIPVGSAVAADGVITITLNEFSEGEFPEGVTLQGWMDAAINTATCDPAAGAYVMEMAPIYFYATPGGEFYTPMNNFVCNAAAVTGSGVLSDDGTQIFWTFDTGELMNSASVANGGFIMDPNTTFICDSLVVTPIEGSASFTTQVDRCQGNSFSLNIVGNGVIRAQVTFTTDVAPMPETGLYMSCLSATPGQVLQRTMATEGSGYGGVFCAYVFPADGSEFITNTASAASVHQGDSLTYNVEVSTSATWWYTLELKDILPQGYSVTSVNCSVDPAILASDTCEVLDDNTLVIGAYHQISSIAEPMSGSISVEVQGVVTAEPGTQLESVACFERRFDPPVYFIDFYNMTSGVICASAITQVIAPPATPTEVIPTETVAPTETVVPSETATPGTPGATPTETTVPVEKQTTVRVEMWDGSGIEGATWSLTAPLASQTFADPYLTGVLDANNSTVLTDLPAGDYLFEVTPNGLEPQEFRITISDQSEEIVLQFAQPAGSATPGATAAPADPTQTAGTSPVTGLPETGNNAASAGVSTLLVAIAAAMIVLMAVGVRVRSSNR